MRNNQSSVYSNPTNSLGILINTSGKLILLTTISQMTDVYEGRYEIKKKKHTMIRLQVVLLLTINIFSLNFIVINLHVLQSLTYLLN